MFVVTWMEMRMHERWRYLDTIEEVVALVASLRAVVGDDQMTDLTAHELVPGPIQASR